jgi:hypothetical protein
VLQDVIKHDKLFQHRIVGASPVFQHRLVSASNVYKRILLGYFLSFGVAENLAFGLGL